MQSSYPAHFVRDMGCSLREWLGWLAAAWPDQPVAESAQAMRFDVCEAAAPGHTEERGWLQLQWEVLPPRQIALLRIPRLRVCFDFEGLSDAARTRCMRRLDLLMQRGGG